MHLFLSELKSTIKRSILGVKGVPELKALYLKLVSPIGPSESVAWRTRSWIQLDTCLPGTKIAQCVFTSGQSVCLGHNDESKGDSWSL